MARVNARRGAPVRVSSVPSISKRTSRFIRRPVMLKRLLIAVPLALLGAAWFYWVTHTLAGRLRTHDPETTARHAAARRRGAGPRRRVSSDPAGVGAAGADLAAPAARRHRRGGRPLPRARRHRLGALREEFRYEGDADFSIFDPGDRRALLASFGITARTATGSAAAAPSRSNWPRTCTIRRTVHVRKLEEFVVARRLERFLDKDRILELYLNVVEWGPGIFGAEAAARHYFSRSAADLSRGPGRGAGRHPAPPADVEPEEPRPDAVAQGADPRHGWAARDRCPPCRWRPRPSPCPGIEADAAGRAPVDTVTPPAATVPTATPDRGPRRIRCRCRVRPDPAPGRRTSAEQPSAGSPRRRTPGHGLRNAAKSRRSGSPWPGAAASFRSGCHCTPSSQG
jgi:hypothetical protein